MFARLFGRKGNKKKPFTRTPRRRQVPLKLEILERRDAPTATIVDFNDHTLAPNSYWNGSDGSGGFTSRGAQFNNSYDQTYGSWSGWSYSDVNDTTTAGYTNQYAAYTGTAVGGSGNYGVGYTGGSVAPTITLPAGMQVQSAMFTNATYAALSMLNGDQFAKKFGPGDWFELTITGENAANNVVGSVNFYLAQNGSIVNTWQSVDLSSLSAATTLGFNLTSSDTGTYGINTPAYFAIDDLTLVPKVAGTFSSFALSVQGGNTVTAGKAFLLTAQATDALGNPVSGSGVPTSLTATASPSDPQVNYSINAPVSSTGLAFFVGTLDTAGSYTISAGGVSTNVTVTPANANFFTVTAPASVTTGVPFNVTVNAFDGFGNVATGYTGTVAISSSDPAASSVTPYHFLAADNGVHTFSATLNSSTLASGFGTILIARDTTATTPPITGFSQAITVQGLVVVPGGFVKTATGFTVTFSKPFTPADLTMYGLNTTTMQDVKMVGADLGNGAFTVAGTLFFDPTTPNTIVFKASNAYLEDTNVNNPNTGGDKDSVALPDDTYTVTLKSGTGTNGFVDALGSHLDGASNGTAVDWTTSFTTTFQDDANHNANPAPVLGIPDFARGPDSSTTIAVPILATGNNVLHGIPITLYNAAAVTDATFTLTYNPQILTPTAGGTGDATVAGSTFTMGAITSVDSTHSTVSFTYHNATAKSGTVILGDITATVPNSAATIYKTKELLALSGITVNGGGTVQAADGIHVDAYVGDVHVTALPAIDASDALDANTIANAPHNSGFTAYGLLDPAIIGAFISGNLVAVGPADVTALFSKAAHLPVPSLPAIPASVTSVSVSGADPTVSLAGAVQTTNGIVSVPVMLDHPHPEGSTGMTEAHLALTYDPSVLSVSSADITLGSIPGLGAGWQITSEVDAATGQIGINLVNLARTPITATQAGSLVNIAFHVVPGAVVPATAVQLVNQVVPNGQRFVTDVDDSQGPLTLTPGMDRLVISTGPAWPGLRYSEAPAHGDVTAHSEVTPQSNTANAAGASEYLSPGHDISHDISQDISLDVLRETSGETTDLVSLSQSLNSMTWDKSLELDWLDATSEPPAAVTGTYPVAGTMNQHAVDQKNIPHIDFLNRAFADLASVALLFDGQLAPC